MGENIATFMLRSDGVRFVTFFKAEFVTMASFKSPVGMLLRDADGKEANKAGEDQCADTAASLFFFFSLKVQ